MKLKYDIWKTELLSLEEQIRAVKKLLRASGQPHGSAQHEAKLDYLKWRVNLHLAIRLYNKPKQERRAYYVRVGYLSSGREYLTNNKKAPENVEVKVIENGWPCTHYYHYYEVPIKFSWSFYGAYCECTPKELVDAAINNLTPKKSGPPNHYWYGMGMGTLDERKVEVLKQALYDNVGQFFEEPMVTALKDIAAALKEVHVIDGDKK